MTVSRHLALLIERFPTDVKRVRINYTAVARRIIPLSKFLHTEIFRFLRP